jgi:hypothetical protein
MTTIPVLADRVMRARRESTCSICGALVRVGNQIARCPGGLWVHCKCFIGHTHNLDRPGECASPGDAQ